MKKILAILLALTLVLALAACNDNADDPTEAPTDGPTDGPTEAPTDAPTEPPEAVEPEELPANPLNHWDFDSAEGLTTVHQIPRPAESELTGVNTDAYDIVESVHEPIIADGPVDGAVYLDGKYGIKLDMTAPTDDSYTIAFWYNGDRFINLGPIIQMGRNVGMANSTDPASAVTWFNICQAGWGTDSAAITPVFWNRNSSIGTDINADGVWPWISAGDDTVYGKQEWAHVVLVVDGVRYVADDGMERIGAKLYVNGELKFDANSENLFYQGVAPEIFKDADSAIRGLEAYVGINYWDACYKGFIDDLYVYDEALTAGQVLSLYNLGDASVTSTAPEYTGPMDGDEGAPEPTTPVLPTVTPDANALATVGTTALDVGFWTQHTASYELKDGVTTTFKFNNYGPGVDNYKTLYTVLCGIALDAGDVDPNTLDGYAEYAVVRPDIFAWTPAENPLSTATYEHSWGDDWATYLKVMTDAEVTLAITRAGATFTLEYTITGADGTVLTEKATIPTGAAADAPVYAFFGADHAYVELLSVE